MSDERREVAGRLREVALHPDVDGDVWVYDSTAALGLEVGEYEGYVTPESVARLADLIDPTCEAVEHGRPDGFHACKSCSKCSYGWFEDIHDKPYSFCPNCGARVVKTGD